MNRMVKMASKTVAVLIGVLLLIAPSSWAVIDGVSGTAFNLTARDGYISAPDGGMIYTWGYAIDTMLMQYPGPTLIVNQGATVTITLKNELPLYAGNVSIVFPGQTVQASGGLAGKLTREAPPDGATTVTYSFTAAQPGTYTYHSGTRVDLQTEMGLVGAIIVRPQGFNSAAPTAYNHADSRYDREYLFLLTEMDPVIHDLAALGLMDQIDTNAFFPTYWFINGRCAPDTMAMEMVPWLPHQPYNSMPRMMPGEKLLLRLVGGGRDLHPFHHHGNNSLVIARDGRLQQSAAGLGADLAISEFTITMGPGETADALFEWTGKGLDWDAYGHKQDIDNTPLGNFPGPEDIDHNANGTLDNVPLAPNEDAADHGKPFPVSLPDQQNLTIGRMFSGSPFLGAAEALPPGPGTLNPFGAFVFMWHSHNEKEMTSNNIFPGGMMTECFVEPPGTFIP